MDKKILKQLKSDYEELEIKPSSDLWDQIESGIDSSSETVQKARFQPLRYAAVIALLISVVGLFHFNSDQASDIEKSVAVKMPSRNNFKPIDTTESIIPKDEINKKSVFYTAEIIGKQNDLVSKKRVDKMQVPEDLEIIQKRTETIEIPAFEIEKSGIPILKTVITEKKKPSYTSADELLLGRELDKTRIESREHKQFGVLDASKLKLKRPSSLQIFGVHVFVDSIVTE